MTFRSTITYLSGVLIACGIAASQASAQDPVCTLQIEINALRGGSPTVTVGEFETNHRLLAGQLIGLDIALQVSHQQFDVEIAVVDIPARPAHTPVADTFQQWQGLCAGLGQEILVAALSISTG